MRTIRQLLIAAVCLIASSGGLASADENRVDYLSQVKPLLKKRCFACHGALKQAAGLRLDTAAAILKGSESGKIISPGDEAATSELLERVSTTDEALRMPPEHEGEPLKPEEIELLRQWIASGAPAPEGEKPEAAPKDHWSFRPIVRPADPKVKTTAWIRNPIDAWIAAGHEQHALVPQGEASRITLLRRLSMDLIGLPPTAEEIAAFEADRSPDWYEKAVNRLLEDPRHGERWARHWMDVWRYSDWWGLGEQLRNSQRHIWHWRDWIVESLNSDVPYDEMVRLMLAADELAPEDPAKLRATGFLARNYFLFNRTQWMDEVVTHVGKGLLGLTLNCARCHDHKFDPFPQEDYYRFRAIFEPYQVRVDMTAGELDLMKDGIPRVFDGILDSPTYRFVRGDEARPDTSKVIAPGVPALLISGDLPIEPVRLPESAWQPGRRPWVLANHIAAAKQRLNAAREKRDRLEKDLQQNGSPAPSPREEFEVAEAELKVAQAELQSVELIALTLQAERDDAAPETVSEKKVAAIRADRQLGLEKARRDVLSAERSLKGATDDKRSEAEKKLATAQETLQQAIASLEAGVQPGDPLTLPMGAQWTATRFASTGVDDPNVPFPQQSTGRRTALANWITDRRNPLTARVAVNHLWNRHFGTPLAPTPFDMGRNSPDPTHPELIDWLAAELMDHGWSMKHVHRLIVTSATYRLSSSLAGGEANAARDPDNRFWWRRTPIRLESQAVRDSILALAGTLDLTRGGPSIPTAMQAESKRRSLYFFHSNNERNLFLSTFDEAEVGECYRRDQSIVPQQALALTNSALVLDASRQIAQRIAASSNTEQSFVRQAFALVAGFHPSPEEVDASLQAIESWKKLPGGSVELAQANLVWILLNHNDFVTLR